MSGKPEKPESSAMRSARSYLAQVRGGRSGWMMERVLPDSERIKDVLGIKTSEEGLLLDVGCGGGWIDIGLALLTKLDFVCVDISPRCVQGTKEDFMDAFLGDRVMVQQADAHELPFADEMFNYVISTSSIGFWHNPQSGIEELYRVLAPGGRIFIRGFDGNRYSCFWQVLRDTGIDEFEMVHENKMSYISIWKD